MFGDSAGYFFGPVSRVVVNINYEECEGQKSLQYTLNQINMPYFPFVV